MFFLLDRLSTSRPDLVPSPADAAENLNTIEDFWDILFPNSIIEIITEHTNTRIEQVCLELIKKNIELQSVHQYTTVTEMKAFISILYYSGLWKSSKVNNHDLWNKKNGASYYRCVMPKLRFIFLS